MRLRFSGRLALDLAFMTVWLLALGGRPWGDLSHELLGVTALALLALHLAINLPRLTKGLRSQKRLARLFVNSLLILAAIPVLATGLAQSKYILSFLDLSGGSALRQTHAVLAYWSLVLIGVHVGLNWSVVWAFIRKKLNINEKRPLIKRFDLLILLLIVIYGVKSFIDRNMLNKLFKGYSYDFWDPERYKIFLFFEYASILIFLVVLTNVLVRLTSNRKTIFSNK